MKSRAAGDFPMLREVFAGYLHEDFAAEHGSAEAALRAFHDDASAGERRRFAKEARLFLAHTATLSLEDTVAFAARLGSRWTPPTRDALVRVLTDVIKPNDSTH